MKKLVLALALTVASVTPSLAAIFSCPAASAVYCIASLCDLKGGASNDKPTKTLAIDTEDKTLRICDAVDGCERPKVVEITIDTPPRVVWPISSTNREVDEKNQAIYDRDRAKDTFAVVSINKRGEALVLRIDGLSEAQSLDGITIGQSGLFTYVRPNPGSIISMSGSCTRLK